MKTFGKSLLWCTTVLALLLAGCDGSSHNRSATDTNTSVTVGVAVDPYIVGAIFYEDKDNSGTQDLGEQQSNRSDEWGCFTFKQPLTPGSTLIMKTSGLHNGTAFTGTLRRLVSKGDAGELAATPLTTLLANGLKEDQVRALLDTAGLALPTNIDLYANPMASLEGLDASAATAEKLIFLKANMVINAYLSRINAYDDQEDLFQRLTTAENIAILTALGQAVSDTIDASLVAAKSMVPTGANLPAVSLQHALQASTSAVNYIVVSEGATPPANETMKKLVAQVYLASLNAATLEVATTAGFDTSSVKQGAGYVIADDGTVQTMQELNDYLSEGMSSFSQLCSGYIDFDLLELDRAKLLTAREAFKQAASLADHINPETATAEHLQQVDQARFFFALTRILTVLNMSQDDTSAEGFKDVGDIIDTVNAIWDSQDLPDIMSSRVFDFTYNVVGMELIGAMDDLALVSKQFSYTLVPTNMLYAQDQVEFDYADVLALKGLAAATFALIDICDAYDLDFNTVKTLQGGWTFEDFLKENATFGTLVRPQRLADAKIYLDRAQTDFELGFASLKAETDTQQDDFFAFGDLTDEEKTEIDDVLAKSRELLSGPVILSGGLLTSNDVELNLPLFFEGIDLRQMLPNFTGDTPGALPDPTFGGVLVNGDTDSVINPVDGLL